MHRSSVRWVAIAVACLTAAAIVLAVVPDGPLNHAPRAPGTVSQVDGETRGYAPMLRATVSDPDADELDVTFYGREVSDVTTEAGPVPEPFTIVVVPDPQKYTMSERSSATYERQMRWIVEQRDDLAIAFVTSVGDLVQVPDAVEQWERADRAWRILDDARVPYSVVPGNHDLPRSGGPSPYDRVFPPSRFRGADWYGGWLGDPTDGIPDHSDRGNRSSYQTFTAGGIDVLVVNLEVDMPGSSIEWARHVIAAHPHHQAIVVTHRWMGPDGVRWQRPLGIGDDPTAPAEAWRRLIEPNCSIVLVLAGHDPGESSRIDENACGEPVVQMVADYQRRPNGGDGWLRTLTFDPASGTIEVATYSVTQGIAETDGDSSFSVPWPAGPAGFRRIAVADAVASGATAEVRWSGLEAGTTYEWYAVASDGVLTTGGSVKRFTTP